MQTLSPASTPVQVQRSGRHEQPKESGGSQGALHVRSGSSLSLARLGRFAGLASLLLSSGGAVATSPPPLSTDLTRGWEPPGDDVPAYAEVTRDLIDAGVRTILASKTAGSVPLCSVLAASIEAVRTSAHGSGQKDAKFFSTYRSPDGSSATRTVPVKALGPDTCMGSGQEALRKVLRRWPDELLGIVDEATAGQDNLSGLIERKDQLTFVLLQNYSALGHRYHEHSFRFPWDHPSVSWHSPAEDPAEIALDVFARSQAIQPTVYVGPGNRSPEDLQDSLSVEDRKRFEQYYLSLGYVICDVILTKESAKAINVTLVAPPIPRVLTLFDRYQRRFGDALKVQRPAPPASKDSVVTHSPCVEPRASAIAITSDGDESLVPEIAMGLAAMGLTSYMILRTVRRHRALTAAARQPQPQPQPQPGRPLQLPAPRATSQAARQLPAPSQRHADHLTGPQTPSLSAPPSTSRPIQRVLRDILDEVYTTVSSGLDGKKAPRNTLLESTIKDALNDAIIYGRDPCKAAAVFCAMLDKNPMSAQLERDFMDLGLDGQLVASRLTALLTSEYKTQAGQDIERADEARRWITRITQLNTVIKTQFARTGPCTDGPAMRGPKSSDRKITVRARSAPAEAPSFSTSSRPVQDIHDFARRLLDDKQAKASSDGRDVFIPDDKTTPHLHVTKDFVCFKKRNEKHSFLMHGSRFFDRTHGKVQAELGARTAQNAAMLLVLDHMVTGET
jgi:hypothetical protein